MTFYHAAGDTPVSAKKLSVQFLRTFVAAGIVAYLLSLSEKRSPFEGGTRMLFAKRTGPLLAWCPMN